MRRGLNLLYMASGALGALFLLAICTIVLLQVGANLIDAILKVVTGAPIGLIIPSYAEIAGFFLVGATFFSLAYTLRMGGHIRVSLFIQHLEGAKRQGFEIWCLFAAGLLSAYFTYFTFALIADSIEFWDVSPGLIPVPLWIPQMPMALGLLVFTIALFDEFVSVLRGREPVYRDAEEHPHPEDEV